MRRCFLLSFCVLLLIAPGRAIASLPAQAWQSFDRMGVTGEGSAGVADRDSKRPLAVNDPVRVASISKLAVAIAVMRLVEARRLDLDRDVSTYLGWTLRHPVFPDRPITLRLLLSHRAGLRDGIDYALPLDADLQAALSDPAAWDADHSPGQYFRYANLGSPIVAAVMEGAMGERFDRLMARLLFRPLGLDACFNWTTCTDTAVLRAVTLYRADGSIARDALGGQRPDCPGTAAQDGSCDLARYRLARNGAQFSPQGGMRIGISDLAVLGAVLDGRHPRILSRASLARMAQPQWRFDGTNGDSESGIFCAYGLGVMLTALPDSHATCRDDPVGDGVPRIGHAGEAYALRSGLWIDPVSGRGIAYFTTQVPDPPPPGRSAYAPAEEALAAKLLAPR